jgi:hypothetical protein
VNCKIWPSVTSAFLPLDVSLIYFEKSAYMSFSCLRALLPSSLVSFLTIWWHYLGALSVETGANFCQSDTGQVTKSLSQMRNTWAWMFFKEQFLDNLLWQKMGKSAILQNTKAHNFSHFLVLIS